MADYGDFKSIAIGFPSVIPPILAMVLALSTKEVVSSLFAGVLAASVIYSIAVAMGKVSGLEKANVLDVMFTVMSQKISENISICLFILCIGALIHLVSVSGGAKAYAAWAIRTIKGRRKSMFSTMALGLMLFLDDYFNSISTSTIMHPVTEGNHVSKAKTAYIVHTMSTNMCIMIPLTSWAAAIMSQIAAELDIGYVGYTITHHTRQSAIGLPMIETREYGGSEYPITRYTMSEIVASVYDAMEEQGRREGILFIDEVNCVSEMDEVRHERRDP